MTAPKNPFLLDGAEVDSSVTLRDLFAGFALMGLLAGDSVGGLTTVQVAHDAGVYADAMLSERDK